MTNLHFKLKDLRSNIKLKTLTAILFLSLICFGVVGVIIFNNIKSSVISKVKSTAMDMALIAASEINGDDLENISSESDEEYTKIFDTLSKYEKSKSVKYIYVLIYDGQKLTFAVDADPSEESRAGSGEEYPMFKDILPAFEGKVCCDSEPTKDRWGTYFSAYAPVYDSEGNISGAVGVDTGIDEVDRHLNVIKIQILLQIAVFYILCSILFSALWRTFSNRDMLTGILNYDSLVIYGNKLRKKGFLDKYTAIQMNIRNFKYINSKIGTGCGDILLKKYAKIICTQTNPYGVCARTGSDNFIALVKSGCEDDIIENLSEIWIDMSKYGIKDRIQISIRCGIYKINENDSIQDAINYTSVAIKNSRISGNNYIVQFRPDMLDDMVHNSSIIDEFHESIEKNEFKVYYQPKVNTETNDLCGAEALVRWIKDDRVIPPAEFIPVLENEGVVTEIDFYVFEAVCRDIADWRQKGITPVTISSNFSKLHLANLDFADSILSIVKKYEIPHNLIEIELTESSGYSNYDALTHFVERMNIENINTSIDDFGTGYSSLSMLKDINVDVVKIDKSFLGKDDPIDTVREKMLGNVIRMIRDLDRTVICEGIETENQLNFLKKADCGVVQGYFFDKPLPHDEFELRLKHPHYDKSL